MRGELADCKDIVVKSEGTVRYHLNAAQNRDPYEPLSDEIGLAECCPDCLIVQRFIAGETGAAVEEVVSAAGIYKCPTIFFISYASNSASES